MTNTSGNHTPANLDQFKNILKKHSLKATPQRLAVHEAMLKLGHASADMVTAEIQKKGGTKVTVASVYNILSNLALFGVYQRRMSSNNKMYFDVSTFKHIHIYNVEDHCYKDVIDDDFIKLVEKYMSRRKFRGFKVEYIDIQLVARPSRKKIPSGHMSFRTI